MTWEHYQTLISEWRAHIDKALSGNSLSGGLGVVVDGETVAIEPRSTVIVSPERGWRVVIWVEIVLDQGFEELTPEDALPLISGPFAFPPIALENISISGPFSGELEVNEYIIPVSASVVSDPPQAGLASSQLYNGDLTVLYGPAGLDEALIQGLNISASVAFYARGHWSDAELLFENGFAVGNYRLNIESRGMDDNVSESTVVATYAGRTAAFTAVGDNESTSIAIVLVEKL